MGDASELSYYQYAFVNADGRAMAIGPGIDPRFDVELIGRGPIMAAASRIAGNFCGLTARRPKTPADLERLRLMATRHNEIVCRIAKIAPSLPLQLGTVFASRKAIESALEQCQPRALELLERLENRQEWRVKLYLKTMRLDGVASHVGPPSPHFVLAAAGVRCADNSAAHLPRRARSSRELHAAVRRAIRMASRCLSSAAEHVRHAHALPSSLSGRRDTVVFNAAFLLPAASRENWLETVQQVCEDVRPDGLQLELTGPWPPYHFSSPLDFSPDATNLPFATV